MGKKKKTKSKKYSKEIRRKLPSFIVIATIIGTSLFFIIKTEKEERSKSIEVIVRIEKVRCPKDRLIEGKTSRHRKGSIKFSYKNKEEFLKIRRSVCPTLNVGDSITVLYYEEGDKFYEKID